MFEVITVVPTSEQEELFIIDYRRSTRPLNKALKQGSSERS
jgi:hypothetical protein